MKLTLPPHQQWIIEAKSKQKIQHRILADRPKAEVVKFTPPEIKKPKKNFSSSIYWSELGDFIRRAKHG